VALYKNKVLGCVIALNNPALSSSNLSTPNPLQTLKVDDLTVQVYESAADIALAGSANARKILQDAIATQGQAAAIFATGRSQVSFLNHLTSFNAQSEKAQSEKAQSEKAQSEKAQSEKAQSELDWSRITGFHLDEYLGIAAEHPASFRYYLQQHLVSKVANWPNTHWHEIDGNGLLPLNICKDYENALRANPIDLCCLGIGNNGHLAFNDPAVADFNDSHWVKLVRLDEQNRQQQADSSAFASIEAVPQYAFTLTLSAIRAARHSLCLANGQGKAAIVRKMLTGPITHHCPASILRQMPQALLLLDRAAAEHIRYQESL
jgi:glucosamine-6-phosphate deaminase